MPNLSWDEVSDLQHLLKQLEEKIHHDPNYFRYITYIRGVIDMIETLIMKHDKEDT